MRASDNNILNLSCSRTHSISFNAAKGKFDCRDTQHSTTQYEFNHHVHCTLCVDATIHHTPDREPKIENLLHKMYKWMLSMLRVSEIYRIINKQQEKMWSMEWAGVFWYSTHSVALLERRIIWHLLLRLTLSQSVHKFQYLSSFSYLAHTLRHADVAVCFFFKALDNVDCCV